MPAPRRAAPAAPAISYCDLAARYVDDVLSGVIPAGRYTRLACQRHKDDRVREDDPAWPYRFDAARGERVARFVALMPHTRGEWAGRGETLKLEPWQAFVLTETHAWVRKDNDLRRFRVCLTLVGRKNGKSAITSALGNYHLCADGEYAAEVYCGATSLDQAMQVWTAAQRMCSGSPKLVQHYGVQISARSLSILKTGSKFIPIVGKPGDGSSPSFSVLDECHEMQTAESRDSLLTGMGARSQPMLWMISTAGDVLTGPLFDDVMTGRAILDATVRDETRFFIEYSPDANDDWTSTLALRKSNPNLGVSVKLDFLLDMQAAAIRNTRDQGVFKTKHLNQFVNSKTAFFNLGNWNKAHDPALTSESLRGQRAVIGLDLASTQDIAAIQLLFPREDGRYATFGRYYLPSDVVRAPENKHYAAWAHDGLIIETEGGMTDLDRLYDDLLDLCATYQVIEVVADPMQSAMIMARLGTLGVETVMMQQSPRNLHQPMHYLASLIDAGKLAHNAAPNDPLTWMMSNVVVRGGFDLQKPSRPSDERKIDAAAAMIMAMGRLLVSEAAEDVSYYENNPLIFA